MNEELLKHAKAVNVRACIESAQKIVDHFEGKNDECCTKYNVLVSSLYDEWVSIEANSAEEAVEHVKNGEWDEVVSKTCVSSEVIGKVYVEGENDE